MASFARWAHTPDFPLPCLPTIANFLPLPFWFARPPASPRIFSTIPACPAPIRRVSNTSDSDTANRTEHPLSLPASSESASLLSVLAAEIPFWIFLTRRSASERCISQFESASSAFRSAAVAFFSSVDRESGTQCESKRAAACVCSHSSRSNPLSFCSGRSARAIPLSAPTDSIAHVWRNGGAGHTFLQRLQQLLLDPVHDLHNHSITLGAAVTDENTSTQGRSQLAARFRGWGSTCSGEA